MGGAASGKASSGPGPYGASAVAGSFPLPMFGVCGTCTSTVARRDAPADRSICCAAFSWEEENEAEAPVFFLGDLMAVALADLGVRGDDAARLDADGLLSGGGRFERSMDNNVVTTRETPEFVRP